MSFDRLKWETQLTYRVEALVNPVPLTEILEILGNSVTGPEELRVNDVFTITSTLVDEFGPINVVQKANIHAKEVTNRLGLKTELVKVLLDAPGALPPPIPVIRHPRKSVVRELTRDYDRLADLAPVASRETLQTAISDLGFLIRQLETE